MKKTYIINYDIVLTIGRIKGKTMKVHNCSSEIEAKMKLHKYMEKKYTVLNLIVHSCEVSNGFMDLLKIFQKK
jgi:hypothetical protein